MQLPITIGLHRSHFLDAAIGAGALLASLAIFFFPQSASLRTLILLVIWITAVIAWRQLAPKFGYIRLERDGRILVAPPGAREFTAAEPLPGATVHPWLTVVRLRLSGNGRRALVVAGDSLDPEDFRRLRVFLRWRADFSGAGDDA